MDLNKIIKQAQQESFTVEEGTTPLNIEIAKQHAQNLFDETVQALFQQFKEKLQTQCQFGVVKSPVTGNDVLIYQFAECDDKNKEELEEVIRCNNGWWSIIFKGGISKAYNKQLKPLNLQDDEGKKVTEILQATVNESGNISVEMFVNNEEKTLIYDESLQIIDFMLDDGTIMRNINDYYEDITGRQAVLTDVEDGDRYYFMKNLNNQYEFIGVVKTEEELKNMEKVLEEKFKYFEKNGLYENKFTSKDFKVPLNLQ